MTTALQTAPERSRFRIRCRNCSQVLVARTKNEERTAACPTCNHHVAIPDRNTIQRARRHQQRRQAAAVTATAQPGPSAGDGVRLFTPYHVAVTTILAGVLGGSLILAWNCFLMKRSLGTVLATVLAGVAGLVVTLWAAMFVPVVAAIPGVLTLCLLALLMTGIAAVTQGREYTRHRESGGQRAAGWSSAGIILLAVVVSMIVSLPVMHLFQQAQRVM